MANPFIGQIEAFAFNFPPNGWALCNGALLPINQNTALFSLLGTQFGGDGRVTFALPDLRGRIANGDGQGPGLAPYVMGQQFGEELHTVTGGEMPAAHNHAVNAQINGTTGGGNVPGAGLLASAYSARELEHGEHLRGRFGSAVGDDHAQSDGWSGAREPHAVQCVELLHLPSRDFPVAQLNVN